jgi:hypothetical protein
VQALGLTGMSKGQVSERAKVWLMWLLASATSIWSIISPIPLPLARRYQSARTPPPRRRQRRRRDRDAHPLAPPRTISITPPKAKKTLGWRLPAHRGHRRGGPRGLRQDHRREIKLTFCLIRKPPLKPEGASRVLYRTPAPCVTNASTSLPPVSG